MSRISPLTWLFVLVGAVPLLVGGAAVAAFLLIRSGYGLIFAASVPFSALIVVVIVLGFFIGRAARGIRNEKHDD